MAIKKRAESIRAVFGMPSFVLLFALLLTSVTFAETLTISLVNSEKIESSDAVMNSELGFVHPHLKADDWNDGLGNGPTRAFSVGDGRHGSFVQASDYLRFHDGAYLNDKVIRINTDTYPDLQFARVQILSGWKIRPFGSKPLVIRSLSTIRIESLAEIDCSGGDGEGLKAIGQVAGGGIGRCGGSNGGSGGSSPTDGQAPAFNANGGGKAGPAAGDGGGGGGAIAQIGAPGDAGVSAGGVLGAGGAAGDNTPDDAFTNLAGGSGGGGGKSGTTSSGGGGGAGGGSIILYAVDGVIVEPTGRLDVNGGAGGGGAPGSGDGGAGGGGGGGSLLVFSRGDIVFDGTVTALAGTGGVSDGGDGGIGADGRTWINDADGISDGVGENPVSFLILIGTIQYEVGTYTLVSKTIDLMNSKPTLNAATMDATIGGAGSVALEIATGDEPFDVAGATWVPAASASSLSGKRYVRFRISLNNADEEAWTIARSVQIDYSPGEQGKFEFSSCGLNQSVKPPGPGAGGFLVFLVVLPLMVAFGLRANLTSRFQG